MPSSTVDAVEQRFAEQRWTAGVIGLGYVGLPLAVTAAQRGLGVIGFDVTRSLVDQLNGALSHIGDVTNEDLSAAVRGGAVFTTDAARLRDADAIFVAVPSPLGLNRQPDMSFIEAAAATIGSISRPGQLISLESTTYPGTTEDIILPAIESAGLQLDVDAFVAFSPERVDPGNELKTGDIPKVVGGVSPTSGRVAAAAYRRLVSNVHVVSTARAAELTKLLENTYRAINIAMVNELAQFAHAFDIDIWEVIEAAATKPFGFQAFYPGPGVGGHCIPLDPQYLAWRAREQKVPTRFIDLAEQVNAHMPEYVVQRLFEELNQRGQAMRGTTVLAVGIAYKPNVADDRESPAVDVLERLARRGARIEVLDPHVDDQRIVSRGYGLADLSTEAEPYDLALVLTDHDAVDYARVFDASRLIFDTRGAYRKRGVVGQRVVTL